MSSSAPAPKNAPACAAVEAMPHASNATARTAHASVICWRRRTRRRSRGEVASSDWAVSNVRGASFPTARNDTITHTIETTIPPSAPTTSDVGLM